MDKNLEENFYRVEAVGFYTFLKKYNTYINDLEFEQGEKNYTIVKDKVTKAVIGYIIFKDDLETSFWYADKNYFNIFLETDFSKITPKKIIQINKKEDNTIVAIVNKLRYKLKG